MYAHLCIYVYTRMNVQSVIRVVAYGVAFDVYGVILKRSATWHYESLDFGFSAVT